MFNFKKKGNSVIGIRSDDPANDFQNLVLWNMYSYDRDIYFSVKWREGDEYNSNFRVWLNFHENKFQKILICQNSNTVFDAV